MRDVMRSWRRLMVAPVLACAVMAGCGDDDDDDDDVTNPDGSVSDAGDAGRPDSSLPNTMDGGRDAGPSIDAGPDGSQPLIDSSVQNPDASAYRSGKTVTEQSIAVRLSATGHDRLLGVTYDQAGNVYAVGYRSTGTTPASDTEFVVAKFLPDGGVDNGFGTSGIASANVAVGGQNLEMGRGIVVQPDGKVVIAGDVDHQVFAGGSDGGLDQRDKDVALVRFNANGTIDTTFGTQNNGIVRENPGDGVVTTTMTSDAGASMSLTAADSFWSLARAGDGKLVLHLASRGDGAGVDGGVRTDTEYTLVRLNENGTRDTTFNGTGVLKTDFGRTNASARTATVLSDGKIIGTGYTTSTVLTGTSMTAQQPVLYKVNADGTPDNTFAPTDRTATPGVWHDYARADQKNAEAYTAGLQANKLVTIGYGPTPGAGTGTDWVFFRFNADGTQDKSFGSAGASFLDPGGYSDNGRGLAVLPDNRIIGVGVGRAKPATAPAMGQPPRSGMIGILGPDGQPDESFAPGGHKLYPLGNDVGELFNVAVSPNGRQAAVVGVKGPASEAENEDSVLILLTTGL